MVEYYDAYQQNHSHEKKEHKLRKRHDLLITIITVERIVEVLSRRDQNADLHERQFRFLEDREMC